MSRTPFFKKKNQRHPEKEESMTSHKENNQLKGEIHKQRKI